MEYIWDPLRKKEVALTSEERVRQWLIAQLNTSFGVPMGLMQSEVSLKLGRKDYRADIVVYDRKARPLMVLECKREDGVIGPDTVRQALLYHSVLNVSFICLSNGKSTYVYRRNSLSGFDRLDAFPDYQQMLLCQP